MYTCRHVYIYTSLPAAAQHISVQAMLKVQDFETPLCDRRLRRFQRLRWWGHRTGHGKVLIAAKHTSGNTWRTGCREDETGFVLLSHVCTKTVKNWLSGPWEFFERYIVVGIYDDRRNINIIHVRLPEPGDFGKRAVLSTIHISSYQFFGLQPN